MINIIISGCSLFDTCSTTGGPLFFGNIVVFIKIIFRGFSLGRDSAASVFFFSEDALSNGHLINSFAPYSDLPTYNSLTMITYFVWGA